MKTEDLEERIEVLEHIVKVNHEILKTLSERIDLYSTGFEMLMNEVIAEEDHNE